MLIRWLGLCGTAGRASLRRDHCLMQPRHKLLHRRASPAVEQRLERHEITGLPSLRSVKACRDDRQALLQSSWIAPASSVSGKPLADPLDPGCYGLLLATPEDPGKLAQLFCAVGGRQRGER